MLKVYTNVTLSVHIEPVKIKHQLAVYSYRTMNFNLNYIKQKKQLHTLLMAPTYHTAVI